MSNKVRNSLTSQASRLGIPRGGQAQKKWLDRVLASLVRSALGKDSPMDRARLLGALGVLEHNEPLTKAEPQEDLPWHSDDDDQSPDEPSEEG